MRRRELAALAAAFALLLPPLAIRGLDWPLPGAPLAAGFGTPARGGPLLGAVLAAEAGLVRSAGEGELLFAREAYDPRSLLPSTLGSFAVVEQPGGMAALYAHLAPATVPGYLRRLKAGEVLGAVGRSGYAEGRGLLFSLFDREARRWVNPLLLLPPLPEDRAPLVRRATLRSPERSQALGDSRPIPQGSYSLALDLADPTGSAWAPGPAAPFYLRVLVDGARLIELRWESAEAREGRLELFAAERKGPPLRDAEGLIVLPPRFFARGSSIVELLVRDYAGNERQASWTVRVE